MMLVVMMFGKLMSERSLNEGQLMTRTKLISKGFIHGDSCLPFKTANKATGTTHECMQCVMNH